MSRDFAVSQFGAPRRAGWWQRLRRRPGAGASGFATSTLQEWVWQRAQGASRRWAIAGAVLGVLTAFVLYAPAAWLAAAVSSASREAIQLSQAQGSIWTGSATLTLTGGAGSRDAAVLPGRLHWRLRPALDGAMPVLQLTLRHAECLSGDLPLRLRGGIGRWQLDIPARPDGLGQWPMAWLDGLGTPWNTMQMRGLLRAATTGLSLQWVQGRFSLAGNLHLDVLDARSVVSPLPRLGSYRMRVAGDAAAGGAPTLSLSTLDGALVLDGRGEWSGTGLRFRGMARAAEGQDGALANLLNIIGRRQGAASLILIG
ncbi:MAG: type II secretion system protein N [Aquabacterium sp.]